MNVQFYWSHHFHFSKFSCFSHKSIHFSKFSSFSHKSIYFYIGMMNIFFLKPSNRVRLSNINLQTNKQTTIDQIYKTGFNY